MLCMGCARWRGMRTTWRRQTDAQRESFGSGSLPDSATELAATSSYGSSKGSTGPSADVSRALQLIEAAPTFATGIKALK